MCYSDWLWASTTIKQTTALHHSQAQSIMDCNDITITCMDENLYNKITILQFLTDMTHNRDWMSRHGNSHYDDHSIDNTSATDNHRI